MPEIKCSNLLPKQDTKKGNNISYNNALGCMLSKAYKEYLKNKNKKKYDDLKDNEQVKKIRDLMIQNEFVSSINMPYCFYVMNLIANCVFSQSKFKSTLNLDEVNYYFDILGQFNPDKSKNINFNDKLNGKNPIEYYLSLQGQVNTIVIESIITKFKINVNELNNEGISILHLVAQNYDVSMIRTLLKLGADINIKSVDNYTPIYYAIKSSKYENVEELIDKGADLNVHNGLTPFMYAININSLMVIKIFINKNKVDLNVKDNNGNTPLHIAIQNKSYTTAQFLIKSGSNPRLKNNNNISPLDLVEQMIDNIQKTISKNKKSKNHQFGLELEHQDTLKNLNTIQALVEIMDTNKTAKLKNDLELKIGKNKLFKYNKLLGFKDNTELANRLLQFLDNHNLTLKYHN
jgi:ankyrin repeat protein